MVTCVKCGSLVDDDLSFCTECGAKLHAQMDLGQLPTMKIAPPPVAPPEPTRPVTHQNIKTMTALPLLQARATAGSEQGKSSNKAVVALTVVVVILVVALVGIGAWAFYGNKDKSDKTLTANANSNQRMTTVNAQSTTTTTPVTNVNTNLNAGNTAPTPTPTSTPKPPNATDATNAVTAVVVAWARSLTERDINSHMRLFAQRVNYRRDGIVAASHVRTDRTKLFSNNYSISVRVSNISVAFDPSGTIATATFDNDWRFTGDRTRYGVAQDRLTMENTSGTWLITGEVNVRTYSENR